MDISDHHHLASHAGRPPLMKLPSEFPSYSLPFDYVNNLHNLDYHNINYATQPPFNPSIANSTPPSLIHCANPPYLMFPNMNMSSISQLDLKKSFDYSFNQRYLDSLSSSIFNSSVDPQDLAPISQANYNYKGLTYPSNHKELRDPSPTTAAAARSYDFSREDEQAASRVNMEIKSEISVPNYRTSSLISDAYIPFAPTFLHNLVDMESHVKEEASFNNFAARTSDCFDFPLPSSFSAREVSITQTKLAAPQLVNESNSSNNEASCSHAESVISTATRCKIQAPKRRKSQQKRVVCVPATGGLDKPTGECLRSDSWAWRKYGQKPIKGSPYPRSYYRCSSFKGCTARKQVERDPSDPLMILIAYTSDHNHSSAGADHQAATKKDEAPKAADKHSNNMISGDVNDQISETSCEPNYSSEENTNNDNNMLSETKIMDQQLRMESDHDEQEQVVSSTTALVNNNNQLHVGLLLSNTCNNMASSEYRKLEEDFFAQLDELPDWFGRNPLDERFDHINDQLDAINHGANNNIDPFDLFNWS